MTQSQEAKTTSSPTVRAELLIHGAGERLGMLAGTWAQRFRHAGHVQQEKAEYPKPSGEKAKSRSQQAGSEQQEGEGYPKPSDEDTKSRSQQTWKEESAETHQPAVVRAEEMVGQVGERMAHWTRDGNLQVRRAMAFLREGADDMWAEAQEMRHQWEQIRH